MAADTPGRRLNTRRTTAVLAAAAATGVGVFLIFLALAWASAGIGRAALAPPIRAAFAAQNLRADASWRFGDTDIGVHQHNDCLILDQALDDRAPRQQRAVSPLSIPPDADSACTHLERLATGAPDAPPIFYHRYLHLHTTLARLLVPALGVRGTRELYRLVLSLLLLAGIAYPMIGLARETAPERNGVFLILFAVFARWFGLETFGQSLGHAPADAILLAYLLVLARGAGALSRRTALVATTLFGAMTMEAELLTGGLPLGLAVVLGALPLSLAASEDRVTVTLESALAYAGAAAACLVAKLAAAASVFGVASFADAARQIAFRTGLSDAPNHDQPAGPAEFVGHVWAGLDGLAPGMRWLVAGVLLLSIAAGGWAYRRLRHAADPLRREGAIALAGSNVVLLLWLVVFWQHTAEHAWFMDRLLVWPIASGMALFFLAAVDSRISGTAPGTTDRPAA